MTSFCCKGMEETKKLQSCRGGILQYAILVLLWKAVSGQIHYSIPEEMQKGSFVGNIAKDLGMDGKHLSDRELRILTRTGMIQYFALNYNSGHLQTSERIDREVICGQTVKCLLNFQVVVESKRKLYGVEVEVTDINDNSPHFPPWEKELEINEISAQGARFPLPEAQDPDLGVNSVQSYQLTTSSHFSLEMQVGENGARHAELVLEKMLDREEQSVYDLILTAIDGGTPVRSGTVHIQVIVLDANDNAPVFAQSVYEANVNENIPKGSIVATISATDLDEGNNGEVKYSLKKSTKQDFQMFLLNSTTGEITVLGLLDYEESSVYEFEVQAKDGGGLSDRSKVVIFVIDLNDNAPELEVALLTNNILENSPVGTVVAILNVHDSDSGINGEVTCSIPSNLPLLLKKSIDNFYSLVTDSALDRELVSTFNITVTAADHGIPPLSTTTEIALYILDTNDNPPLFEKSSYMAYLLENNPRGSSIFALKANDPDWEENSRTTYSIIEGSNNSPLSSYVSMNSETGVIYALSSFDYEEFREVQFQVKAQDGGSPPLSSNVSVTLFILDQNDNTPEILYPSPPTDGSTGVELAPRSSEPGYLVTKVVAVDADSGQNGWLSYQLVKATEPGLFTVGLHTGEIRTTRFFLEKDTLKQSLVVLVKDNGQPSLSASVTVTVVLADSIPEILSDLSSISAPAEPQSDLTFYLVVAVAFVSCLFFTFLLVLLAIRLHKWRNSQQLFDSGSVNFSGVPVSQFVGVDGVRAFLQSYCHEVSLTTGSRKSQFNHTKENNSNLLTNEQTCNTKDHILVCEDLIPDNGDTVLDQVS